MKRLRSWWPAGVPLPRLSRVFRLTGIYFTFRVVTVWWWPMDKVTQCLAAAFIAGFSFWLMREVAESVAWERRMRREMMRNESADDNVER